MPSTAIRPLVGAQQPEQDLDQGRLARPVGPDEADDPGLDLEAQVVERGDRGESLGQRFDVDDGRAVVGQVSLGRHRVMVAAERGRLAALAPARMPRSARDRARSVDQGVMRPRSVVVCELVAAAQAKRMGAGRPLRRPSQREDATARRVRRGPNGPVADPTFGLFRAARIRPGWTLPAYSSWSRRAAAVSSSRKSGWAIAIRRLARSRRLWP